MLPQQEVAEAVYQEALQHFNEKEMVVLSLAIAHMNMLDQCSSYVS